MQKEVQNDSMNRSGPCARLVKKYIGRAVDNHHVIVSQQVVVILIQLNGIHQLFIFLERLFGNQGLERDRGEEGRATNTGQKTNGGCAGLHGVEHADIHFLSLVDLIIEHHMGNGIVGFHLSGKKVLAAVRLIKRSNTQIQHDINRLSGGGRGEAQQRANQLPDAAVVIIHIGPGLIEIEALGQHVLRMEYRRLIVDKALQINVQRFGDIVKRFNINGDRSIFVFGKRSLAFIDHGRKLLNGITATLAVLFDSLANVIGERTQTITPKKIVIIITYLGVAVNRKFPIKKKCCRKISVKSK